MVVAISVLLTAGAMLVMGYGGIQLGLARNVAEYQEAITDSAIVMVDSADAVIRCFAGDCP